MGVRGLAGEWESRLLWPREFIEELGIFFKYWAPVDIYMYLRLEPGTQESRALMDKMFASFGRAADPRYVARNAAARNVIVKLARPFSGEEDLFKHMVSFL